MTAHDDLKEVMRQNYLEYASYVILERAIPHAIDGLKPVQRRILHTLYKMDDGRLHKVANVAGQTMAYHPHGDAPITDALVNLANKGFLLDRQGNFGNLYTGDPASASRYIETRLSGLARETVFNPDLTETVPSYDGRHQEPTVLPVKIPLLLMQGAEGIAVGMSTRILPHNFVELLEGEIAFLEGTEVTLLPDFPTGGIMDASDYDRGRGKVRLRAKITLKDDKTLLIEEICHGTTTESLTRSIDEAAKKGKLKIESIHDYTAEQVAIEITLPRGQHAKEVCDALYAFTDCEVSLNAMCLTIRDHLPWESTVDDLLQLHATQLKEYCRKELEIERDRLLAKIFHKTLEQIFIENRLYKKIETVASYDAIHTTIEKSLHPFHNQLDHPPTHEDRERLLAIPIRRISRFDIDKNQEEIRTLMVRLGEAEKSLKNLKRFVIQYLKKLLKQYGDLFPRKTEIETLEKLDLRSIKTRKVTVGYDTKKGFLGTTVKGEVSFSCTNYDKVLIFYNDGTFTVLNIPEKEFIHSNGKKAVCVGVADKKTLFRVIYRDDKKICYGKRFVVDKFTVGRDYPYLPEGATLDFITTQETAVNLSFFPSPRQKQTRLTVSLEEVMIKGYKAKGVRLAPKPVRKVTLNGNHGHHEQLTLC